MAVQRAESEGAPVGVLSVALAGFASRTLTLRRATPREWHAAQPARRAWSEDGRTIENGLVRVRAAADGTLTLTDKTTGETVSGILRF